MATPFEQSSFPEIYERVLVEPLFRPWIDSLLNEAELSPGDDVLDIACGTGIVARCAKERVGTSGRVVGVDVSPAMLEVAIASAPDVDWRVGDALALPLADGKEFDVVLCQQGFQFFSDRQAAVREMRRALAPGGRLALSSWCADTDFPVLFQLRRVAERHLGPIVDRRHCLGDATAVEDLLREEGFTDVRSKTEVREICFQDGGLFVRLNALALLGMAESSSTMTDQERDRAIDAIAADSTEVVRTNTDHRGFVYEIGTTIVTARVGAS